MGCVHGVGSGFCNICRRVIRPSNDDLDWQHYVNGNTGRRCDCDVCYKIRKTFGILDPDSRPDQRKLFET